MILLDTDHLTILKYPANPGCIALSARMDASPDQQIGTTIITVEEQWRGWLAVIARTKDARRQVRAYRELASLLDFLNSWSVVPFEDAAAIQFEKIRQQGVRIGSMDLKIACIALVHDALVLSDNLNDFRQVPGLRVESWIH